jgi:hypothetical protein
MLPCSNRSLLGNSGNTRSFLKYFATHMRVVSSYTARFATRTTSSGFFSPSLSGELLTLHHYRGNVVFATILELVTRREAKREAKNVE